MDKGFQKNPVRGTVLHREATEGRRECPLLLAMMVRLYLTTASPLWDFFYVVRKGVAGRD